ncbi:unnamed protein product [Prorocentrum cordatum]|uniref:Helicase ATP-binding domain-containing protein n=1 Tax=Prorocentrum cordatum TaxID=2364126 RepID=A0ABN9VC79_9DINO|nr:unnamed protein product [Polarella glacialis]
MFLEALQEARLAGARACAERRSDTEGRPAAEVAALSELFPYPLDEPQREAARRLAEGEDVLCCMPTGSGKTAVGLFAVWRSLLRGRRAYFTTPLKALSGQKRRELSAIFGQGAVGLVTGDHSVLPGAPVVVMTTEVFRNLLYLPNSDASSSSLGLDQLDCVVLDELHFINNPSRGVAWEEAIIHCPPGVQILGLSATVGGDPEVFCQWWARTRGRGRRCRLVSSDWRPVPLHFYVLQELERRRAKRLYHLADSGSLQHARAGCCADAEQEMTKNSFTVIIDSDVDVMIYSRHLNQCQANGLLTGAILVNETLQALQGASMDVQGIDVGAKPEPNTTEVAWKHLSELKEEAFRQTIPKASTFANEQDELS